MKMRQSLFSQASLMKIKVHQFWLILAAYGVWFAIFSGLQEAFRGVYWKALASLILGIATYFYIEYKLKKQ